MIDVDVFEQLLEMDEDDREFSQSLVWNYFEQAESTFQKMDGALYVDKDGGTYNYRIAKSCETAVKPSNTTESVMNRME